MNSSNFKTKIEKTRIGVHIWNHFWSNKTSFVRHRSIINSIAFVTQEAFLRFLASFLWKICRLLKDGETLRSIHRNENRGSRPRDVTEHQRERYQHPARAVDVPTGGDEQDQPHRRPLLELLRSPEPVVQHHPANRSQLLPSHVPRQDHREQLFLWVQHKQESPPAGNSKRHTAHGVTSPGRGYPSPSRGGNPSPVLGGDGGVPQSWQGGSTPVLFWPVGIPVLVRG